jgi:hypothetical protein
VASPAARVAAVLTAALALAAGVVSARGAVRAAPAATITTVVGTGVLGSSGDGGPASEAEIDLPRGIALEPDGGFVFADAFAHTVRRVLPDGTITAVAGTGTVGFAGDGGPAVAAEFDQPHGVAITRDGTLLIADTLNERIRAVSGAGTITTVAGTGEHGFSGDGGPSSQAAVFAPRGVTAAPGGGFLIPDSDNNRIREVAADGTITTVAGTGEHGFSGDGGPATSAELSKPFAVVPTLDGGLLISDIGNNRVRKVDANGTITTVAGNGIRGYAGDGGPAVDAELDSAANLAALPDGGFLIADGGNDRVRRVWPDGTITTIVGTGEAGFSGDGGPAAEAEIDNPTAIAVLPTFRGFLLADAGNHRIRLVTVDLRRLLVLRVAVSKLQTRHGRAATLVFDVPDPVSVRVKVRRRGRLVASLSAQGRAGRNALRFGAALPPGTYTVTLRAWGTLDQPAERTLSLVVRRG